MDRFGPWYQEVRRVGETGWDWEERDGEAHATRGEGGAYIHHEVGARRERSTKRVELLLGAGELVRNLVACAS